MILEEKYGLRILRADDGKKITDFDYFVDLGIYKYQFNVSLFDNLYIK